MDNILFEKIGQIAKISINRPGAMNALNSQLLQELNSVLAELEADKEIRVLIISAKGSSFVAGADIKEMQNFDSIQAREYAELGLSTFKRIEDLAVPVIASINGYALGGGCELALACEIRYASDNAKFGQPEVGLGIIPGFGASQRLARLVGIANAKELIYTGKIIDASEALRIGLVNKLCTSDSLEEDTMKLAQAIVKQSPSAVKYAKVAINSGIDSALANSFEYEKNLFSLCFSTKDQKKGMQAFIEKRKANF